MFSLVCLDFCRTIWKRILGLAGAVLFDPSVLIRCGSYTKKIRPQVCLEPDLYVATRCHAFRSSCDVGLASPIIFLLLFHCNLVFFHLQGFLLVVQLLLRDQASTISRRLSDCQRNVRKLGKSLGAEGG